MNFERFKETLSREEVRSISRRYFISNGFDGALASIGVTVGSFLSGVPDGLTVFKVGIGAAVGLATSGIWSVWEIEKAEKLAELKDLEKSMQRDLEDTNLQKRKEDARIVNSLMSGTGPVIGIVLPLVPFLFEGTYISMLQATIFSVAIGVGLLFGFGAYMAGVSKQNWVKAGLRIGLAGLVVAAINIFLPG